MELEYNAKGNKSFRERQIPNYFTHIWNLNKTNEQRKERERPKNRFLAIENNLMVTRGKEGGKKCKIGNGN